MQVIGMDSRLIEINNIRNLTSVKLFDLTLNASSGLLVVPSLMITYDGGKTLNLCAKDDYFNEYVRKVIEVYKDEKDNILEDSLSDPFRLVSRIDIDERTKKILESGELSERDKIAAFYGGKDSYDAGLLFQIDEIKSLVPIIKYHIEHFFKRTNQNVIIGDDFSGYRDKYYIDATVNGVETPVPLVYEKIDENTYTVYIGNLLGKNRTLEIKISFKKDKIEVDVATEDGLLHENSEYRITYGVVKEIHDMDKEGFPLGYENKDLERSQSVLTNLSNVDEDTSLDWFMLPWGDNIGIKTTVYDVTDTERIIEIHSTYLSMYGEEFSKREYYSKTYKRNKTATVDGAETVIVDYKKRVTGTKGDGYYIIETVFGNGEEYYYHGTKGYCLEEITRDSLVSLTKKENINRGSDLLNKYKLRKILRSE